MPSMISHATEWEEHDVCAGPNPTGPEVILVLKKQFFVGGDLHLFGAMEYGMVLNINRG